VPISYFLTGKCSAMGLTLQIDMNSLKMGVLFTSASSVLNKVLHKQCFCVLYVSIFKLQISKHLPSNKVQGEVKARPLLFHHCP
jgi:hypothetical protein